MNVPGGKIREARAPVDVAGYCYSIIAVNGEATVPLTPSLFVDGTAEDMATYYADVFPDGVVEGVMRAPGPDGTEVVITANIRINDTPLLIINGGQHAFTDAFSFVINCETQAEVDHFWDRFVGDGGAEIACGWCKDKFGFCWQVMPAEVPQLLQDPDPERSGKAFAALRSMMKIDAAAIKAAMDS